MFLDLKYKFNLKVYLEWVEFTLNKKNLYLNLES